MADQLELDMMNARKIDGYFFFRFLGWGQIGKVYGVSKEGKNFALKRIWNKTDSIFEDTLTKMRCIFDEYSFVSSGFLVKYLSIGKIIKDRFILIFMELCGSNAKEFVENRIKGEIIPTDNLMKIVIETLLGLFELHNHGKIHGNIKPENVFINENYEVKLGDFGMWIFLEERFFSPCNRFVEDPYYFAPEVFGGHKYGPEADIWSLGVVFYYLCTGTIPFSGDIFDLPEILQKGEYLPIQENRCPGDVCEMISLMLCKDLSKRPTVLALLKRPHIVKFAEKLNLMDGLYKSLLTEAQLSSSSNSEGQ